MKDSTLSRFAYGKLPRIKYTHIFFVLCRMYTVWTANRQTYFSLLNAFTTKVAGLPHVYNILCNYFEVFGAFEKFRKVTICIRLVCPSVRPHTTTRLPLDMFLLNFIFQCFKKRCWENSSFIKIGQEDQYTRIIISRSFLLRMKNVSDKSWNETQITYFMFNSFFFFLKIVPFFRCGKIL
jgi:hypothetical protein